MGEVTGIISRKDYEGGRHDRVRPPLLADVGSCAIRELTGSPQEGMAATEHEAVITGVTPRGYGFALVEFMVVIQDQTGEIGVESRDRLCNAAGYIIAQSSGEDAGDVVHHERGYFIRGGLAPDDAGMERTLQQAASVEELLVAHAA
jgi:hypothetical protein